jgi:cell division control protein 6
VSDDILEGIFTRSTVGKMLIKDRKTLTIDYVPEKLPFRDEEAKTIAHTLSIVLKGARPSNLLLFGKPGTGKTAVIKNIIKHLQKKAKELEIEVIVPFVNAKTSNTAYKVLYEIAEEMGINKGEKKHQVYFTGLSMGEATDRILDFIQNKKKLHVILVIDEIDSLVEKNGDDILYSFTRANERMYEGGFISLIGISNSLTFKDKLDPRVRSSLSEEEMVFNPYTILQLQKILSDRAKLAFNDNAISTAAINLCAAMAGKENGDARKAIDLLRVAAEIQEIHIRQAQEKIEKDTNYEVLKNSTTHTKIVLLAITKSKNGNTGEVYEIYSSLCKHTEQEPLTQRRMTQIVSELDQLGLVMTDVVSQGRYGRSQRIKIALPSLTIKEALKDDPILSTLLMVD